MSAPSNHSSNHLTNITRFGSQFQIESIQSKSKTEGFSYYTKIKLKNYIFFPHHGQRVRVIFAQQSRLNTKYTKTTYNLGHLGKKKNFCFLKSSFDNCLSIERFCSFLKDVASEITR